MESGEKKSAMILIYKRFCNFGLGMPFAVWYQRLSKNINKIKTLR